MSMRDFKNESLFDTRISPEEARRTAEYALAHGWCRKPDPRTVVSSAPKDKKRLRLNCEQFRTVPYNIATAAQPSAPCHP
jgi:hypothetical protein